MASHSTYAGARTRNPNRGRGWFTLTLFAITIALAWYGVHVIGHLPQNWKTLSHVRLDQRPAPFANWQLNILALAPKTCLAALGRANIAYTPLAERPATNGCGIDNGVRVARRTARFSSAIDSTCVLTAALAWWEEAIDADAMATMGSHIARVDHVGTYACRNINGVQEGPRSEHATANAIDITGFTLANGRHVTVAHDWNAGTPEGRFLALARADACRFFNAVLSPDYNALHHDHFHLDLGFWRACR